MMKKSISLILVLIILITAISGVMAWSGPNIVDLKEVPISWVGLWFSSTVKIQPSYIDNGYNYARGYFIFDNGPDGYLYTTTATGTSANDSNVYVATNSYRDWWSFDTSIPKVTWSYGASKVQAGSGMWPY